MVSVALTAEREFDFGIQKPDANDSVFKFKHDVHDLSSLDKPALIDMVSEANPLSAAVLVSGLPGKRAVRFTGE